MTAETSIPSACCFTGRGWCCMGEVLRFVEIGSDFKFADLGADVPVGVVVAGVGAWVYVGVGGFRERVVCEPQLDLD